MSSRATRSVRVMFSPAAVAAAALVPGCRSIGPIFGTGHPRYLMSPPDTSHSLSLMLDIPRFVAIGSQYIKHTATPETHIDISRESKILTKSYLCILLFQLLRNHVKLVSLYLRQINHQSIDKFLKMPNR